jgi:hypothetical protein
MSGFKIFQMEDLEIMDNFPMFCPNYKKNTSRMILFGGMV